MVVYTFMESYDFSGKTIVPFATYEGSGLSSTESSIAETCSAPDVQTDSNDSVPSDTSSSSVVQESVQTPEAILLLEDNAAARDFASQLPLKQTFEDFNSIEKICRLQNELTTEGVDAGVDSDIADVTLYIP